MAPCSEELCWCRYGSPLFFSAWRFCAPTGGGGGEGGELVRGCCLGRGGGRCCGHLGCQRETGRPPPPLPSPHTPPRAAPHTHTHTRRRRRPRLLPETHPSTHRPVPLDHPRACCARSGKARPRARAGPCRRVGECSIHGAGCGRRAPRAAAEARPSSLADGRGLLAARGPGARLGRRRADRAGRARPRAPRRRPWAGRAAARRTAGLADAEVQLRAVACAPRERREGARTRGAGGAARAGSCARRAPPRARFDGARASSCSRSCSPTTSIGCFSPTSRCRRTARSDGRRGATLSEVSPAAMGAGRRRERPAAAGRRGRDARRRCARATRARGPPWPRMRRGVPGDTPPRLARTRVRRGRHATARAIQQTSAARCGARRLEAGRSG